MSGTDRVIRWSTALAVLGVAAVAAVAVVASYEHAYDLVRAHGEAGWTGRMVPFTVDELIYATSMVMLDAARRKTPIPAVDDVLGVYRVGLVTWPQWPELAALRERDDAKHG
jgi:Protein of unknown function (DUF2637)